MSSQPEDASAAPAAAVVALALGGAAATADQLASLTAAEREQYDYLARHIMPTLSVSLEALLREREAREPTHPSTPAPPIELVRLNPLGFVAQHLMRNNPMHAAGARGA